MVPCHSLSTVLEARYEIFGAILATLPPWATGKHDWSPRSTDVSCRCSIKEERTSVWNLDCSSKLPFSTQHWK